MNWYYVELGKQAGPVDDAQLDELRRTGKIQLETLVWHEGMANWAPYREARPDSTAGAPPPIAPIAGAAPVAEATSPGVVCAECGKVFPTDQMIRYGNAHVCANCKPVFMQKLAEGAAIGQRSATMVTEQQLFEREYRIDIGEGL